MRHLHASVLCVDRRNSIFTAVTEQVDAIDACLANGLHGEDTTVRDIEESRNTQSLQCVIRMCKQASRAPSRQGCVKGDRVSLLASEASYCSW